MTTLHKRKLNMGNALADVVLQKQLNFLDSELRRQLAHIDKRKQEARRFMKKMRRCDSDRHPNAIRYLAAERLSHGRRDKASLLPPLIKATSETLQNMRVRNSTKEPREYRRRHRNKKLPTFPQMHQMPQVEVIPEIKTDNTAAAEDSSDNNQTSLTQVAERKPLCTHGTIPKVDKREPEDLIDFVKTANLSPYKPLPKIDASVAMVNIGEQTNSAKNLSRLRV